MASRVQKANYGPEAGLSTSSLIDLSLRNHLCFIVLRTEHGSAFHLGTIVRTMFASFFLYDAGFGIGELSVFADLDLRLGELALSHRPGHSFSLTASAVLPVAQLLRIYDSQLQTAPLYELVAAHQRAERNFQAPPETRLSLAALIQRSKRGNSGSAFQSKQ